MLSYFDIARDMSLLSICLRLGLAVFCGGLIGAERELKRRSAGFRTHILICLGAAMTTLTSQYLFLEMGYFTDMGRLGAQVIAGIGFMGAGAIMVTKHNRVKGLTTAAGLWVCGIVGISLGAGFYEGALATTIFVLLVETTLSHMEHSVLRVVPEIHVQVEYAGLEALDNLLALFRTHKIRVLHLENTRIPGDIHRTATAIFNLRLPKSCTVEWLLIAIVQSAGVRNAEEL